MPKPPKAPKAKISPEQRIIGLYKCMEYIKARQRHNEALLQFLQNTTLEQKDHFLKDELKLDYSQERANRAWPVLSTALTKDIGNEQICLRLLAAELEQILLGEQPDCLSIALILQVHLAMANHIKETSPGIAAKARRDLLADRKKNKLEEAEYQAALDILNIGIEAFHSFDSIRTLKFIDQLLREIVYDPIEHDLVDKYVDIVITEDPKTDEVLASIASNLNFNDLRAANVAYIKDAAVALQRKRDAILAKFKQPDFIPVLRDDLKLVNPHPVSQLKGSFSTKMPEVVKQFIASYRYEYFFKETVDALKVQSEQYLHDEEQWLQQQVDFLKAAADTAEEQRKIQIAERKRDHELALLKQKEAKEAARVRAQEEKRRAYQERVQAQLRDAPIVTARLQRQEHVALVSMDVIDANIAELSLLFADTTKEYPFLKAERLLKALGFILGSEGGGSHREIIFKDHLVQELKTVGGFAEKTILRGFNLHLFCVGISSLFPEGWQQRLEQGNQAHVHAKWKQRLTA